MTLLTVVRNASDRIGVPRPDEVAMSTDQQVRQMMALANQEGRELARSHDWQALVKQHTFVTVDAEAQPDAVPDDWDKFIPDSFFNRSQMLPLVGPITPQEWQAIIALPAVFTFYLLYRQRDGAFLITPSVPADQTIAYEYRSKNWCESAGGTPQSQYEGDTDVALLDEEIITDGLVWRFLRAKGVDYSEEFATYERQKQRSQARDGSSGALNAAGFTSILRPGYPNIPIGNFPG